MSEIKLKPCPFCGGEGEMIVRGDQQKGYWVKCLQCGAETRYFTSERAAAEAWNMRALIQDMKQDELAELLGVKTVLSSELTDRQDVSIREFTMQLRDEGVIIDIPALIMFFEQGGMIEYNKDMELIPTDTGVRSGLFAFASWFKFDDDGQPCMYRRAELTQKGQQYFIKMLKSLKGSSVKRN